MSKPIVIGIDPSVTSTGIATHDGKLMVVKYSKAKGDDRLLLLHEVVDSVRLKASRGAPASLGESSVLAVLEDLPANAMGAGHTAKAQGVVRNVLQREGISYLLVPPATLKKYATGKGNAKKDAMIAAWNARGEAQVKDDNMADAAFLRLFGVDWLSQADHRALYDSKVRLVTVDEGTLDRVLDGVDQVFDRAV